MAVVWPVSFLNKFCWIWSSGVVINTLRFLWMKWTCDVSKMFSQIESLKSLKYRKESFWSIIRFYLSNPSSLSVQHRNCVRIWSRASGNYVSLWLWRFLVRFTWGTCNVRSCVRLHVDIFLDNTKYYVLTKKSRIILKLSIIVRHRHWESNSRPSYHSAAGNTTALPVCYLVDTVSKFFLFIEATKYRSNFCKNDSFRKLFLFFEITFQYVGGISQDISVSHFDSRRSLWVRHIDGDLPRRFFLSALLSLVISMTGRSARALRDGADVVRVSIGN